MTAPLAATSDLAPDHVVDVLIIGAGLSGIGAAYRLQTESPDRSYAVLEARAAIGGTWDLFRYPGVRSDSDIYTFSYPFAPWKGEQSLADGPSIRRYVADVAAEFGIDQHLRFGRRVVAASWSSVESRWTVRTLTRSEEGAEEQVETWSCGFLYSCAGYYDYEQAHAPHFEGQEDFDGEIVHPQFWPADLQYSGRRVVIIGSGATAVTLVPAMARTAGHVTMLQRSPTWMTSLHQTDPLADRLRRRLPAHLAHRLIRIRNLTLSQAFYRLTRVRPDLARRLLSKPIIARMGAEVANEHFTPSYDPWDQRLCVIPDGDLLTAVREGRAEVVTDHVDRFVPEGVRLASGRVLSADLVVSATGLQLKLLAGMELSVDGEPVALPERTLYRGLMLDGVPNFALAIGYVNASWTLRSDLSSRYVCRFLNHLRDHGLAAGRPGVPAGLPRRPVMPLTSGYVERARATLPQQGPGTPWAVPQNYPLDLLQMRRADVTRDMRFQPARTAERTDDRVAEQVAS